MVAVLIQNLFFFPCGSAARNCVSAGRSKWRPDKIGYSYGEILLAQQKLPNILISPNLVLQYSNIYSHSWYI